MNVVISLQTPKKVIDFFLEGTVHAIGMKP